MSDNWQGMYQEQRRKGLQLQAQVDGLYKIIEDLQKSHAKEREKLDVMMRKLTIRLSECNCHDKDKDPKFVS